MNEDAVSPVVAAMLLLAIFVTLFAAWNACFVPSLKAQSEITHISEVESGFLRFSSDIGTAASLKKTASLREPVPLGGGDFIFDTTKSGGLLNVRQEDVEYLSMAVTSATDPPVPETPVHLSGFTYQPVGNFWQDQGYSWSYGMVNVTKGTLATPLEYLNMDSVSYGLTGSLFDLDTAPSPVDPASCTVMTVYTVNMSPMPGSASASGNGNGILALESTVMNQQYANATDMMIRVNPNAPEGFRNALWKSVNDRIRASGSCGNIHVAYPDPSPSVNLSVQVFFDAIPNMTVVQKTVEISVAAY